MSQESRNLCQAARSMAQARAVGALTEYKGDQMSDFFQRVEAELDRARALHAPMQTRHEGYAVILEEVRELERAVFVKKPQAGAIIEELIHVAAMCGRMAEDVFWLQR